MNDDRDLGAPDKDSRRMLAPPKQSTLILAGLFHGRERVLLGMLLLSFLNMCCASSTMFTSAVTYSEPSVALRNMLRVHSQGFYTRRF